MGEPLHEKLMGEAPYFSIVSPPPTVGYYQIGGPVYSLRVTLTRKPRWLTRMLCWYLLEWKWIDTLPRK